MPSDPPNRTPTEDPPYRVYGPGRSGGREERGSGGARVPGGGGDQPYKVYRSLPRGLRSRLRGEDDLELDRQRDRGGRGPGRGGGLGPDFGQPWWRRQLRPRRLILWVVGLIVAWVALSFVLLMILFRSLVIPATAAIMNLFSATAAFGVIVAVFQFGWLDTLVGVTHTGPITPLVPILMFAVLFGLSMDYEVFLVSRMHEEWLKLRDNDAAVRIGQAITGKTITAAASIMIVVFSSFVITTDRTIKMIGLGMAVAILIDALLIRTVLVPAVMHTFGRYNWALPAFLDRRLPRLSLEASGDPAPERPLEPVARSQR